MENAIYRVRPCSSDDHDDPIGVLIDILVDQHIANFDPV
jgi:hypothetical protein